MTTQAPHADQDTSREDPKVNGHVRLDIAIVGGGIAGLTAAIALRRAGHKVTVKEAVYEQSSFSNEIGAAIHCAPNATRVLARLGFNFEKANAVKNLRGYFADGITGEVLRSSSLVEIEKIFEYPWYFFHRVDLHNSLKDLAFGLDGPGSPAVLKLQSRVISVNSSDGSITLEDSSIVNADVVIGADGVHSTIVKWVVQDEVTAHETGQSAFRFLVPTENLMRDEKTKWLVSDVPSTMNIFRGEDRRLVAYPCRRSEFMNFVAIHPDLHAEETKEAWNVAADKEQLAEAYAMFHPSYRAILNHAEDLQDLKLWKLLYRPPLPTWTRSNVCLIGDAAHPMLPHQGQGGGMSIEDAGALGVLLSNVSAKAKIPERLRIFQSIRYDRASAVQIFSNFGQDEAEKMEKEASIYCSGKVPTNQQEFHQYLFSYNVLEDTKKRLDSQTTKASQESDGQTSVL